LNNKSLSEQIITLVHKKDIQVLLFCEVDSNHLNEMIQKLSAIGFKENFIVESRNLVLFHKLSFTVSNVKDSDYYSVYNIQATKNFLIMLVHLPSRAHQDMFSLDMYSTRYANAIKDLEDQLNIFDSIVVGDFNLNPYSFGMMHSDGFFSTFNKLTAARKEATVLKEKRRFFFNPMWYLYAKNDYPVLGSYHKPVSGFAIEWHMFDQVLIRPGLIPYFVDKELEIVTDDLLENNQPKYSDHLPVKFTINI